MRNGLTEGRRRRLQVVGRISDGEFEGTIGGSRFARASAVVMALRRCDRPPFRFRRKHCARAQMRRIGPFRRTNQIGTPNIAGSDCKRNVHSTAPPACIPSQFYTTPTHKQGSRCEGAFATACKPRFSAIRPRRYPERPASNRSRRSNSSNWSPGFRPAMESRNVSNHFPRSHAFAPRAESFGSITRTVGSTRP